MLSQLFGLIGEANINVDIIVQSEHDHKEIDVAFSVQESEKDATIELLESAKDSLGYAQLISESGLAKVSAVGMGMMTKPGVAAENVCHAE